MKLKSLTAKLAALLCACGFAFSAQANVAQIGETTYGSLVEAVAAVPTDGTATTITMTADEDSSSSVTIPEGAKITLDGGADPGYQVGTIVNNGTLTLKGYVIATKIVNNSTAKQFGYDSYVTCDMENSEGATFTAGYGQAASHATITGNIVNRGTFTANQAYFDIIGNVVNHGTLTFTASGGSISSGVVNFGTFTFGKCNNNTTISGGIVNYGTLTVLEPSSKNHTKIINGGIGNYGHAEITTTTTKTTTINGTITVGAGAYLKITGPINAYTVSAPVEPTTTWEHGTVAENFRITEYDDTGVVVNYVAQSPYGRYETFKAAWDDVMAHNVGNSITLLDNASVDAVLSDTGFTKGDIYINLNGHTLTVNAGGGFGFANNNCWISGAGTIVINGDNLADRFSIGENGKLTIVKGNVNAELGSDTSLLDVLNLVYASGYAITEDSTNVYVQRASNVPAVVHVDSIALDKTEMTLAIGETNTLTATISPANATEQFVVWSAGDINIASIETPIAAADIATIKVIGQSTGTAYISARPLDWGTDNPENYVCCTVTVTRSSNFYQDANDENVLHIANLAGLVEFRNEVNAGNSFAGKTVVLDVDIDMSSIASWDPIGQDYETIQGGDKLKRRFAGTFDGNNKTLSNLTIDDNTHNDAGLFGVTGYGSTFKDLTLDSPTVNGRIGVGAVAGQLSSCTVTNCHITGDIVITGYQCVGGLAGQADYSNIHGCSVIGSNKSTSTITGVYDANIEDGDNIGGLVGMKGPSDPVAMDKEATIDCTVKNLTVKGCRKVGGLFGQSYNCEATKNATVDNIDIIVTATVAFARSKEETMGFGGMVGIFADNHTAQSRYPENSCLEGTVSNVSISSASDEIDEYSKTVDDYAKMGIISGGQRGSTDFVDPTGMSFNVTVSGTNSTTGTKVSNNTTAIYSAKPLVNYVTLALTIDDSYAAAYPDNVTAARAMYEGVKYESLAAAQAGFAALFGWTGTGFANPNNAPFKNAVASNGPTPVTKVTFDLYGTTAVGTSNGKITLGNFRDSSLYLMSVDLVGHDGAEISGEAEISAKVAGGYDNHHTTRGKFFVTNIVFTTSSDKVEFYASCANIGETEKVVEPSELEVVGCTFHTKVYEYSNSADKGKMTYSFHDNVFISTGTETYALHIQTGVDMGPDTINFYNNIVSNYVRGININVSSSTQTKTANIYGNTFYPGVGYSAVQLSTIDVAFVTNNVIYLDAGNAITLHENLNDGAVVHLDGNTIAFADGASVAYIVYDDAYAGDNADALARNLTMTYTDNTVEEGISTTQGVKGANAYGLREYVYNVLNPATYAAQIIRNNEILAQYETITAAIVAAEDGDTIQLLPGTYGNVDLTHIHGRFDTATYQAGVFAPNVTILGGEGVTVDGIYFNGRIIPNNWTIKNVTFSGNGNQSGFHFVNGSGVSGLTVDGCKFLGGCFLSLTGGTAVNTVVTNCLFDGVAATGSGGSSAIYIPSPDGLTVTGCTIRNGAYNAIQTFPKTGSADVIITGNTFQGVNSRIINMANATTGHTGTITISGNTFYMPVTPKTDGNYVRCGKAISIGENTYNEDPSSDNWSYYFLPSDLTVTAGTYANDVSTHVADGYKAVANGTNPETWTVVVLPTYTVTFDLNAVINEPTQASFYGGMSPDSTVFTQINLSTAPTTRYAYTATVVEGQTVSKPFDANGLQVFPARRDGYVFGGWQLGGVDYDFTTPVTADITLTANWKAYTDSITIADAEDFLAYATMFSASIGLSGVTATLTGDVNFTDTLKPWNPLTGFSGTLDGANHKITGLNVNATSDYVGLFYQLNSGSILNLTIESPTIQTTGNHVGALAGTCSIPLSNVHVIGNISVIGKDNVGGISGKAGNGASYTNCSVVGSGIETAVISGTGGAIVGGLISETGNMANGPMTITGCRVSNVTVVGVRKIGGLIGQVDGNNLTCTDAEVSNVKLVSNATTSLNKDLPMGGLVGAFVNSRYTNDIFSGTVSDITMTGPAELSTGKNYIMGWVSGGTGGTLDAAEAAMTGANMTFAVTVSGTNTRMIPNESTYAGINGNQPAANVAKIGETEYETLAAAILAAQDGDTIVLLCDIALTGMVTIDKSVKIDGDGNTITVTKGDANYYALYFLGETRAIDCEIKNATIVSTGYQVAIMGNCDYASTLKVENVDITCDGECIYANGFITVNATGCEFLHEGLYAEGKDPVYYSAIIVGYSGTINLTDCDIVSFGNGVSTFPSGGTVTMTNVNIDATEVANSENSGFAMWVRNEDYTSYPEYCTDSTITFESGCVKGNFKVTDKYTGDDARNRYDAKTFINGGIFSVSPAGIDGVVVKDGYKVAENTDEETKDAYPYAVVEANYVAQIVGGAKFESLDDAFAAANAGDTVTLLADITYGTDRSVPVWTKPVSIDLGGHTLTTNSEVGKDLGNGGYTAAAICFSIPAASAASITISNGKIVTAYGAGIYADDPGLTLTLSNLTIEAAKVGAQSTAEYSAAIRVTGGAKVIIESGSYSGAYAIAASNSGADFVINGGTFAGDIFFSSYTNSGKTKSVAITGGTFNGGFVNADKGTLVISGGYFDRVVPANYIVEGKLCTTKADFDGFYTIVPAKTVTFTNGDTTLEVTLPSNFSYPEGDPVDRVLEKPTYESSNTTFVGWKDAQNNTWAKIPAGTDKDLVLTATWESARVVPVSTTVVETTPTVKVAESWVTENNIQTEGKSEEEVVAAITQTLAANDTNGLQKWQNYVLGQDKDNHAAVVAAKDSTEPTVAELDMTFDVPAIDTGFDVTYRLDEVDAAGETVTEGTKESVAEIDLEAATEGSGSAYFQVKAVLTPKGEGGTEKAVEVNVQKTVGVVKVDSAAEWTIVAVPWESLADGESKEIKASELIHLGNRSNGDELRVYTAGAYQTWKLQDGNWVQPTRSFKATKSGSQENSVAGAGDVSIPRGAGVWLKRVDPTAPIYLLGQKPTSTETVETTLEKPDSQAAQGTKAWNLVASPNLQEVDVAKLLKDRETTDKIIVPTAGAPKNYTYENGEWGYDGGEVVETEVTMPNGVKIKGFRPVRVTGDTKISGTTGFWYLNGDKNSTGKKINWSTEL